MTHSTETPSEPAGQRRPTAPGRLWRAATTAALAALVTVSAAMLVPAAVGYKRYVIEGGSMSGTLERGSLAYDSLVPASALRVGDLITYVPPRGATRRGGVTHRIVWIGRDRTGARAYRTKGDANPHADPWRFTLHARLQARVAFHLPYLGYVFAALSLRWVRLLVIGGPAAAIAAGASRAAWRAARIPAPPAAEAAT